MLYIDPSQDIALRHKFRAHVDHSKFPCLGAKSALARGTLRIEICHDIRSGWDDLRTHEILVEWSRNYGARPTGFRSLAFVYRTARNLTEREFEEAMWARLQSLSDKDAWRGTPYDPAVSADPSDPHFSLSFGGQAYFVVGLHPGASRPARTFIRSVLVFNLHNQFEVLRREGRYEKFREAILKRDANLAGDRNPMLARHGEISEARQYSGRAVGPDWRCPFHDRRGN